MNLNRRSKFVVLSMLSLAVLVLIRAWGYLLPGLPETSDAGLLVIRAVGFDQSFMDGHWPVRWISQLHELRGYPVATFLYPLLFYLMQPLQIVGIAALTSLKLVTVLSLFWTSLGLFYLSWQKHKDSVRAVFISGLFIFHPFVWIELYQRGSIGEIFAISLVPWIVVMWQRWLSKPTLPRALVLGLAWSLLIPAHNSQALIWSLMFVTVAFLTWWKQGHQLDSLKQLIMSGLVALMASAWFWIPALSELNYTVANQIQLSKLDDHWLATDLYLFTLVILGLSLVLLKPKARSAKRNWGWYVGLIASGFLMLPLSEIIWQGLGLARLIQFPVRWMSLWCLIPPILLSFNAWRWSNRLNFKTSAALLGILLLLLGFNQLYWQSPDRNLEPAEFYTTNFSTSTTQAEFTPRWVEQRPSTIPESFYQVSNPEVVSISQTWYRTQEQGLRFSLEQPTKIEFNTHYYPHWQLLLNGRSVEPEINHQGQIQVDVDPESSAFSQLELILRWQPSLLVRGAEILSALTILLVIYYVSRKLPRAKQVKLWSGIIIVILIGLALQAFLQEKSYSLAKFEPDYWRGKYQQSQWVDPTSTQPIGDHGLYLWAGWSYVSELTNPILINPEMPPLGKYIYGLGLQLIPYPAFWASLISLIAIASFGWLANQILKSKFLSFLAVALFASEAIFIKAYFLTMLDQFQLLGWSLALLGIIKYLSNQKSWSWLVISQLGIGLMLSTKFIALGMMVIASIGLYLVVHTNFRTWIQYLLSLPLAVGLHTLSYWRYFQLDGSISGYLGIQKWIVEFYQQGKPNLPLGSFWNMVATGRWTVWWSEVWGSNSQQTVSQWRLTWPISLIVYLFSIGLYLKNNYLYFKSRQSSILAMIKTKIKLTADKSYNQDNDWYILVFWLSVYGAFLTISGGWPHYLYLWLPATNILLIKFGVVLLTKVNKKSK